MTKTWDEVWKFRANLYGSLGNMLLEPIREDKKELITRSFWDKFPLEAANPQLKASLERLSSTTKALESLSGEEALERVMIEYTELFLGPGVPKSPPFESFYRSDKKLFFGEQTFSMQETLRKFGLESKRKGKQPEDHLGLELLFISVQTDKVQDLDGENQLLILKEQISFIEDNLLTWVPELCNDAKKYGSVGFYGGLFELILGVLQWDRELLEEFITAYDEPIPQV